MARTAPGVVVLEASQCPGALLFCALPGSSRFPLSLLFPALELGLNLIPVLGLQGRTDGSRLTSAYIVPSVRRLEPEQILSQGAVCPASQLLPFGECPLSGEAVLAICSLLNPKLLPSALSSMVELSYP